MFDRDNRENNGSLSSSDSAGSFQTPVKPLTPAERKKAKRLTKSKSRMESLNTELFLLQNEMKRRSHMTIHERAQEIKHEVDKELAIERDTGWVAPPPNTRHPQDNDKSNFPLYLCKVVYLNSADQTPPIAGVSGSFLIEGSASSTTAIPPYFLFPKPGHAYGVPSSELDFSHWELTDELLRDVLKANTVYERLICCNSLVMYDNRLKMFAAKSSQLKSLFISNCAKISPYGIKVFFQHLTSKLVDLDISSDRKSVV